MTTFQKSPLSVALTIGLATCALNVQAEDQAQELAVTKVQEAKASQYKVNKVSTHKISTKLADTPKTITVITSDLLDDQGVTTFADALRNVSGVSTFGAGEGGGGDITTNDKLTIRGFSANESIYIDGIRDLSTYSRDLFNFEQIEVSKGANSSIAGKGTSGGSVNLVTKRANTDEAFNKANVQYDEADTVRGSIDSNILINKETALRVNAVYSDGGDVRDNGVENYETTGLALSLAHHLSDKTTIVGDLMVLKQDNTPVLGLPFITDEVALSTGLTEGAIDESLWDNYYGIESRDSEDTNVTQATIRIEHELSETSRLISSTRFVKSDRRAIITRPVFNEVEPEDDTLDDFFTDQIELDYLQTTDEENDLLVTQLDFVTQLSLGGMTHNLVVGGEAYKESYKYYRFNDDEILSSATVDLVNPAQDVTVISDVTRFDEPADLEGTGLAIYALDTIAINDHWLATVGARFERFSTDGSTYERDDNRVYFLSDTVDTSDTFLSYNVSIAYKPNENSNYYLGYSNSETPSLNNLEASRRALENELEPEEAETLELGAKWEFMDDRILVSTAIFQTEKTVGERDDNDVYFLAGKQEVTGFEFSVTGELTDDLSIIASYTNQDSEITESLDLDDIGNGLSATPDETATVWLSYVASNKLTVAGGAQYSSGDIYWRRSIAFFETGTTTLFNAMASYEFNDALVLQVNIDNLTDKEYITDYSAKGHFLPGAPRNVKLGLSYKF